MKRLLIVALAVVVVTSLILTGCAKPATPPIPAPTPAPAPAPASVIELRFGHHLPPPGRTTVKFLNAWAKKVEAATNGRVKITMYPAESLFKATEAWEATTGGVTDIGWTILGYYTGRFPLTSVMALPFLNVSAGKIDGKVRSGAAVNSHILQELYETIPEIQAEWKDAKLLMLNCTDPCLLYTAKKPVRNMKDLQGLKVRELGGYPSEMWKLLGATPVNMGMPDVYESLSKGVLEGTSSVWGGVETFKFYDVIKYYTDVATVAIPGVTIMNLKTWNSLPPDIQKAIMSVSGINGAEFAGDQAFGFEAIDDVFATMKKVDKVMEKVSLDLGELDQWKKVAGKPLWDRWVSEVSAKGPSQKIIDETLRLLEKYK